MCVQNLTFLAKKALVFQFNFGGSRRCTIKLCVALFSPQVCALICAKGFIKIKQVVFEHTLDNQRVSNSVFSVSSYILVLRYEQNQGKLGHAPSTHLRNKLVKCFTVDHCVNRLPLICGTRPHIPSNVIWNSFRGGDF